MFQTKQNSPDGPASADCLVDRRQLKRRLNKWRGIALIMLLIAFFSSLLVNKDMAARLGVADQIARVEISGVITDDQERAKLLDKLARTPSVKAVVVRFNSPGGTTTGGEALYTQLRRLAKDRPVVAVFGTMATSAAYMSGVAADHIVARANSITGSVGVIMQWAEVSQMMGKLGIDMNEMKSGNLKAVPSPFEPLSEDGRQLTQEMIDESHKWFVDLVVKRRNITPEKIPGFMKGRIFSGRQALSYGLIDAVGGERQALEWLVVQKKISSDLPVIDWQVDFQGQPGLFGRAVSFVAEMLGLDFISVMGGQAHSGLMSIHSGQLISK